MSRVTGRSVGQGSFGAVTAIALAVLLTGCTPATPLSRGQGERILDELRLIRQALEAQSPPPRAAQGSGTHVVVALPRGPALGAESAPVTMIEFTDYQCPFCRRYHDETFARLLGEFVETGKVRYVASDLPLPMHAQARPAAAAAFCAHEQGRFWEYRSALFERQAALSSETLIALADQLRLDRGSFETCLRSGRPDQSIEAGLRAAREAGLTGTPSFLIGKVTDGRFEGEVFRGAQPFDSFADRLKAMLADDTDR